MNYFELYQLPVSFAPPAEAVKAKYYELSRKYHPDRFTLADADTQAQTMAMAALNNKAYNTLSNTDATLAYVLELNGLLHDEGQYKLPPDFLMEMMDLNEAVSDYEADPTNESGRQLAEATFMDALNEVNQQLQPLTEAYDATPTNGTTLAAIKDLFFRKKYLLRIQERIVKFAARQK